MSEHNSICLDYGPFLRGSGGPPAAGSPNGTPFVKRDTSSAGSPTILGADGGGWACTMDNTSEAQIIGFDMNDELAFDIDDLQYIEWLAALDATPGTAVSMVMGLAGAYNAAFDSVAQNCWFKYVAADDTAFVETDDGTNDNDDKSTGIDQADGVFKRYRIDFATGVQTRQPQLASLGGKSNVIFQMSDANGHLTRVCSTTLFDMSNYSGGLQFYAQVQKASGTATGTLTIKDLKVGLKSY